MSEHRISLEWKRDTESFEYDDYTRDHVIVYGSGAKICASAAPEFHGNPECLDPEQTFVSALASCHMLTFLAYASKMRYVVDSYVDKATGVLGKNEQGKEAIIKVELRPVVTFRGERVPSAEKYESIHTRAHDACFIANSIHSCVKVVVTPELKKA